MDDTKKITAAISAVTGYLKTEEETAAYTSASRPSTEQLPPSSWRMDGRQTQMQIRNMMSMRAFHGRKTS